MVFESIFSLVSLKRLLRKSKFGRVLSTRYKCPKWAWWLSRFLETASYRTRYLDTRKHYANYSCRSSVFLLSVFSFLFLLHCPHDHGDLLSRSSSAATIKGNTIKMSPTTITFCAVRFTLPQLIVSSSVEPESPPVSALSIVMITA